MTSLTLSNRINSTNIDNDELKPITDNNYSNQHVFQWPTSNQMKKPSRALSCNEEGIQSSSSNNNRFKHLYTRLKRRFSISKDYQTRSEDTTKGFSIRSSNYKSFSSSIDDTFYEFEWPDFEKVYDSIPTCLRKTLPGLDDISIDGDDDDDDDNATDTTNFLPDETPEQSDLFEHCKRGKDFRRNAICRKLDKTLYKGQLDTFIQQLMIEKLMRTWT